jgi:cyclopropane-fatty-acyl-phospholipid synthase
VVVNFLHVFGPFDAAVRRDAVSCGAGITVSQEQLVEALERVNAAGLQDRIHLVFCDYREVVARYGVGAFDAVVSCEMIEAVGHEHLPIYFDIIGQALKPGGYFAMQVCSYHLLEI